MKPLTLQEFAEDMRRKGDIRQADMADEILALIDIEADIAEPYSNLIVDLEIYAPTELNGKPEKAMEWLGDRSNMLADIEAAIDASNALPKAGANGIPINRDPDDAVKELLEALDAAKPEYDL